MRVCVCVCVCAYVVFLHHMYVHVPTSPTTSTKHNRTDIDLGDNVAIWKLGNIILDLQVSLKYPVPKWITDTAFIYALEMAKMAAYL